MVEHVKFVSLGDSIATGTLTPFSNTSSFVYYLRGKLRETGYRPQVTNLAQDGDRSRDLLSKLDHSDRVRGIVQQADVLTVSIGGNDLLGACSIPGFASINLHMAERGAAAFVDNWPRIAHAIRALNPAAHTVVLSLYNPYNHTRSPGGSPAGDRRLCELTDRFLAPMNRAIADHAPNRYRVADVYGQFKSYADGRMHRVSCLYPESVMRNPHPTPRGQRMIADLVFAQLGI